jgi:D-alanyl-lipoteichoic acid acyltransferase DltB (MBOAT superfamily)
MVVLAGHLTTMTVIGLWHGVTLNFLIWGLWHGVDLFIHKQWSDRTRKWYRGLEDKPWQKLAWMAATWFITFHFVVLGWVWFALPSFDLSINVFAVMFWLK